MGAAKRTVIKMSDFKWTSTREKAAMALSQGLTIAESAEQAGVAERTIYRWLDHPEFSAEVDRLTHMVNIASRAERLRLVMRVVRQKVRGEAIQTDKDLLDWLKFAQSETDGVKLDLLSLYDDGS